MAQTQTSQSLETIQASLLNDSTFLQELVERTLQQILDREFSDFLGATPPNAASCLRLVTALCQEQSDEWEWEKRYLVMIPQRDEQGAAKVG